MHFSFHFSILLYVTQKLVSFSTRMVHSFYRNYPDKAVRSNNGKLSLQKGSPLTLTSSPPVKSQKFQMWIATCVVHMEDAISGITLMARMSRDYRSLQPGFTTSMQFISCKKRWQFSCKGINATSNHMDFRCRMQNIAKLQMKRERRGPIS